MQRPWQDAQPSVGNNPERPLRAAEHAIGADTGARAGEPPRLPDTKRSQSADRLGHVLDVSPERGEMPGGPSGKPATKRGVLKRLWKVPQGEAMLGQLLLQARPTGTGLDARGARDRVELKQAIEPAQVKRDGAVAIGRHFRANTADDTGATAKRNHGDALSGAPLKHALDVSIRARVGNEVRRMRKVPPKSKHDLGVGLTQGMRGASMNIGGTELGKRSRNRQPHRREAHIGKRQRILDLKRPKAEMRSHTGGGGTQLQRPRLLVGKTPAPMLVRTVGHEFRVYAH